MRMQVRSGLGQWQRLAQKQLDDPKMRMLLGLAASFLGGFCLSAASLGNRALPLCLAVLCAGLDGWLPMTFALGSGLGYWAFWGQEGVQGLVWLALGLPVCVLTSQSQRKLPLLMPSVGALIVAASGLVFQLWQRESISVAMYLLQIALAFGVTCLMLALQRQRGPVVDGLAVGVGVLALVQIAPFTWLNLGFVAAGAIALLAPFPAVAVAGLALDLTGAVPVPMTAVLCLAYFIRLIPFLPEKCRPPMPGLAYLAVMALCGQLQWLPLPALALGGLVGLLGGRSRQVTDDHSAEAHVQSRLETVAGVLAQTGQLLKRGNRCSPDEGAVMARVADRACGSCPCRTECTAAERVRYLPQALLHQSAITVENLPSDCRCSDRLLMELQQGQALYRLLCSDRHRQQEYRTALAQQYGFLAEYLRDTADRLPHREEIPPAKFRPETAVCSRGRESVNGDRCFRFQGADHRFYMLLCDGMGTGEGAAYEAKLAGNLLRRMLVAGYSAHAAVQSLNSLCALRSSAGAVTIDLAEADLVTGRVTLYKWGAAPSWLLGRAGWEKIEGACLPPGLSLEESRETVERVTLQHGAVLLMASDGVDGDAAVGALAGEYDQPAGFLAALVLENGVTAVPDDATAAVLRLHRLEK